MLQGSNDIGDETGLGHSQGKKEEERKNIESKQFGSEQVLRYLEKMKQESKTDFTPPPASK